MFHAAALALDDVSRGVSRSSLSRSLTRDRGLGPARWGPRSRPVRNDGARRGGAVRAQVFTVGIIPYASGPVKLETRGPGRKNRPVVGAPANPTVKHSWPHVSPAPLLQLHDVHDARLDDFRLGNERNFFALLLLHILLRVVARHEGNVGVTLAERGDSGFHWRSVVAEHVKTRTVDYDFDLDLLPRRTVVLGDVGSVVERKVHGTSFVGRNLQNKPVTPLFRNFSGRVCCR